MRLPERETGRTKISSPLTHGSLDSNDSDPIDISRRSSNSAGSSYPSSLAVTSSPTLSYTRNNPTRSCSAGQPSSHGRIPSFSKSVGSFVGSYEESILSGRMSQTPSKPLDFTASIGVLGRGKCKSSLRCPPHLTLPFPAYFYSEVSPYVGQIDIEQGDQNHKRGYRIPAEGQLQVIIKNPNKAAIKLFLIPYDVSDMPPLSKTFFRQKHYDDDKLRYAIHIQICCPSEGKYYIHKSQRVVFANRVPDGKESLRIIIQAPEQKYTPWVPEKKQKKVDQHQRPDSKTPTFIGGSLLDCERSSELEYTDGPLPEGQLTPIQRGFPTSSTAPPPHASSPSLAQGRRRSGFKPSNLSLGHEHGSMRGPSTSGEEENDVATPKQIHSGILAERLRALSLDP